METYVLGNKVTEDMNTVRRGLGKHRCWENIVTEKTDVWETEMLGKYSYGKTEVWETEVLGKHSSGKAKVWEIEILGNISSLLGKHSYGEKTEVRKTEALGNRGTGGKMYLGT